jgi:hypothetical protein
MVDLCFLVIIFRLDVFLLRNKKCYKNVLEPINYSKAYGDNIL